jgi:hypothetical protein
MSNPPASRRQPSIGIASSQLRQRWYEIASRAYRRTGLSCNHGPFELARVLGIEATEAVGNRRAAGNYCIAYPIGLPRFERALFFYRAIARILLECDETNEGDQAIQFVADALTLPPDVADNLDLDELTEINRHVHPAVLAAIYRTRTGSGLMPVAG